MLIYIGQGFIPDIPARDLSVEEVKQYGGEKYLLSTGLWKSEAAHSPTGEVSPKHSPKADADTSPTANVQARRRDFKQKTKKEGD